MAVVITSASLNRVIPCFWLQWLAPIAMKPVLLWKKSLKE
jgi:hypothetical protein